MVKKAKRRAIRRQLDQFKYIHIQIASDLSAYEVRMSNSPIPDKSVTPINVGPGTHIVIEPQGAKIVLASASLPRPAALTEAGIAQSLMDEDYAAKEDHRKRVAGVTLDVTPHRDAGEFARHLRQRLAGAK